MGESRCPASFAAIKRIHISQNASQPGIADVSGYEGVGGDKRPVRQQVECGVGRAQIEKVDGVGNVEDGFDIILQLLTAVGEHFRKRVDKSVLTFCYAVSRAVIGEEQLVSAVVINIPDAYL